MGRALIASLLLLLVLPAAPAPAAGGPTGVVYLDAGRQGVTDGRGTRYVAFPGREGTVVARLKTAGAEVEKFSRVPGMMGIPTVAADFSPGGLSADGGSLVLFRQPYPYPPRRATFAVLDTQPLQVRRWVRLRGAYSFDALSPDGSTMYLVHYLTPSGNLPRYEVRAYDLERGRLLPGAIVDPEEPDERMAGIPITRATGPEGRWEYTLYDGQRGHEPFIHALDTVAARTVCIDLPQLEDVRNRFLLGLEVNPETGEITVMGRSPMQPPNEGKPLVAVEPDSFEVSPIPAAAITTAGGDGSLGSWWPIPAALALIFLAAGLAKRGRWAA